ncbi:hypothetical protein [Bradyrhizobium icense]|uniref:hypothetical protein n=1 Tax=Bradyrhizobium icense TaxID=1274631 RepID=UPI0018D2EF5D|nr:hypothetical protein [Bradyrhizobium icense]
MLATVVAAQFMFGVDTFNLNVAIPTIAAELHASLRMTRVRACSASTALCSDLPALLIACALSIIACAAFLTWMRQVTG